MVTTPNACKAVRRSDKGLCPPRFGAGGGQEEGMHVVSWLAGRAVSERAQPALARPGFAVLVLAGMHQPAGERIQPRNVRQVRDAADAGSEDDVARVAAERNGGAPC